jgi:hypothetical protein
MKGAGTNLIRIKSTIDIHHKKIAVTAGHPIMGFDRDQG